VLTPKFAVFRQHGGFEPPLGGGMEISMYKLLIVEDETSSREGLKKLFSELTPKLEIETAVNGIEGYEKALYFKPDIIISDIHMPKINGLEMIKRLRQQNYKGFIYLLTGYAEFEYAQKALLYSVSDYILKPIVPDQIISKIKDAILGLEKAKQQNYFSNTEKLLLLSEEDTPLFCKSLASRNYTDCFYAIIYMEDQKHLPASVLDQFSQISNLHMVLLSNKHYYGIVVGFENNMVRHSVLAKLTLIIEQNDYLTCIYNLKKFSQVRNWFQEFELLQDSVYWSLTYHSKFFIYENRMSEEIPEYTEDSFYQRELKRLYLSENYENCLSFILKRLKAMQE
jgi:YesN/AraC family two-component response regulator